MQIVTLTSDFGTKDPYLGILKAKLLDARKDIKIIDLSNEVKLNDILSGAMIVKFGYKSFPKKTIHLIAVGSSSAESKNYLIAKKCDQIFLMPNNGLISIISNKFDFIGEIPSVKVRSFQSVEIFSSYLRNVIFEVEDLEKKYKQLDSFIVKKIPNPHFAERKIIASIIYIDQQGNLILNITKDKLYEHSSKKEIEIKIDYEKITSISKDYSDVQPGDCLALFNYCNFLEIAINEGNASELLGMKINSKIEISLN